VEKKIVGNK